MRDAKRRTVDDAERGLPLVPDVASRMADTMFALATPSRVQILACLRSGPHAVAEIVAKVEMEQSAVSHQLRLLRDHRLVRVSREGRHRVYTLYDDHVAALFDDAMRHVGQDGGGRRAAGEGDPLAGAGA